MNPHLHDEHIQHSFDAFCKKVLRNEARDYLKQVARRRQREISFSELPIEEMNLLSVRDKYFFEENTFDALGHIVEVASDELADALSSLPVQERTIILLSYFLDMTDREIAEIMNTARSTVTYRRTVALRMLKNQMGGKADDTS